MNFQRPVAERAQRRPAHEELREVGLGVERRRVSLAGAVAGHQRPQAAAVGALERRQAGQVAASSAPRRSGSPAGVTTRGGNHAGPRDDERHAQRRLVDEQPVRALAVLAQALAVVAGHDHQRAAARPVAGARQQLADQRVVEGDLAVVRPAGELFAERRRRRVRIVRRRRGGPRGRRAGRAAARAASQAAAAATVRSPRRSSSSDVGRRRPARSSASS